MLRTFIVLLLVGIAAGFVVGFSGMEIDSIDLFFNIFMITMVVYSGYYLYIVLWTKNVTTVDRYIHKKKKQPYYALLISMVHKDYDQAEQILQKLNRAYNQTKISLQSSILLETHHLKEAEEMIAKIKNHNVRHHNLALLALINESVEEFEKQKSFIKHKGLQYSLEAEAAYKRKDLEEAERLGELAIASTAGLQRWVLVKSLEHQRNNPERKFYF